MSDNGEVQENKVLEMRIVAEVGNPMVVHFPVLSDKIITYGFLKMAEKVLDTHYANEEKKIVQPKGNIINFVRRMK